MKTEVFGQELRVKVVASHLLFNIVATKKKICHKQVTLFEVNASLTSFAIPDVD